MGTETIDLKTADGTCRVHLFHPAERGPWPGVLMFMDAFGIRPALFEIADRLASAGYYVMLPDLYYRTGYQAPGTNLFSDPAVRTDWMTRIMPTVSTANIMRDLPAFFAHLDRQESVRNGTIGTVGYCLGGRLSLSAAGTFPERIAAAAAYHPGQVATDAPDSPHRLAPEMVARVYVGRAMEDASFDDAQLERLEGALTQAGVEHQIETYPARHGWVPSDHPMHDAAQAERHWDTLIPFFGTTLGD